MGTSLLLLPLSLSCTPRPSCLLSTTHLPMLNQCSSLSSSPSPSPSPSSSPSPSPFLKSASIIVLARRKSGDQIESQFLDENGVIDDMDSYLDYLSLEYDSVWDTKPSWCQPWTITLTGVLAMAFSWLVLQSIAVTTIVSLLICFWWYVFLYSYPKAYADMICERRKRVTNGDEDTYGALRKKQ